MDAYKEHIQNGIEKYGEVNFDYIAHVSVGVMLLVIVLGSCYFCSRNRYEVPTFTEPNIPQITPIASQPPPSYEEATRPTRRRSRQQRQTAEDVNTTSDGVNNDGEGTMMTELEIEEVTGENNASNDGNEAEISGTLNTGDVRGDQGFSGINGNNMSKERQTVDDDSKSRYDTASESSVDGAVIKIKKISG